MSPSRVDSSEHRYGIAFERLSRLLYAHDPIGISFGDNTDEYDPEARTILPRLGACRTVAEVGSVVHEEFVAWFEEDTAGGPEPYAAIARGIWEEVIPLLGGSKGNE